MTPLHGGPEPRWGLIAAGERPPRFSFQEPDVAFLTSAALTLADRPTRIKFLRDAAGNLHLMHDGHSVGTAAPGTERGEQLPVLLTALANRRAQPEALAHFFLAARDLAALWEREDLDPSGRRPRGSLFPSRRTFHR